MTNNLHKIATKGAVTTLPPASYIGNAGELTLDTSTGVIHFHDGSTPGGAPTGGGGGSSNGSVGTVQISNGNGAFLASNFADVLSVAGSVTAELVDQVSTILPSAGLQLRGTTNPTLAIAATSSGAGSLYLEGFHNSELNGIASYLAGGTRGSPTAVTTGKSLFALIAQGETGSGPATALSFSVSAASNFSSSQTSTIHCTNASEVGWHILPNGAFVADTSVIVGTPSGSTSAGDVNIAGQFKVNGTALAQGSAGVLQSTDGSGNFQATNFSDTLSTPGSVTAKLVDSVSARFPSAGLQLWGHTTNGLISIGPASTGASTLYIEGFTDDQLNVISVYQAKGTRGSPQPVTTGTTLLDLVVTGEDGDGGARAMSLSVNALSNYGDVTATSEIHCTNASEVGWHVIQDGTLVLDSGLEQGVQTGTASSGAITLNGNHCIVVSEDLSDTQEYDLTFTNSFIKTTSLIQITAIPSNPSFPFPSGIVCSSGSAEIGIVFASTFTGTVQLNISVFN